MSIVMFDVNRLGPNLSRLLKAIGMSQAELAERCGITQACVSQIVNGSRVPSLNTICKIMCVIPVKFEELLK